jgi:5'-nucleotidase
MRILLTNDDGIYAPGIYAMAQKLKRIGTVTVVAPESEKSSVGHGITLSHPIWYRKVTRKGSFFGYGISGTPADCVKFGIAVLLKHKPDVVVSGINLGPNDGCSVFYSGTVAGAREGALMGIPSLAISLATFRDPYFSGAAHWGTKLVKMVFEKGLPKGTFLSVNVPNKKAPEIKGVRVTRQGTAPIHGEFHKRKDPNLRDYYWMTGKMPAGGKNLAIDTIALAKGYVTITPIHCDLTDSSFLDELGSWKI